LSRDLQFPRPVGFDESYWLCRCEGFAVERPDGRRVGIVSEVHYGARLDRPDELVVCGGVFGNRVLVVPERDVVQVVPRELRVVAQTEHQAVAREPLARLRASLLATLRSVH
jgi:hypothetical protein